jgi:hypothetical protein
MILNSVSGIVGEDQTPLNKRRIDTVFDYKQVFKDYYINSNRAPPRQNNGPGVLYSRAAR